MQHPKPHDLAVGKAKQNFLVLWRPVGVLGSICSSDLWLGVICQSCAAIAGSYRNETKVQPPLSLFKG